MTTKYTVLAKGYIQNKIMEPGEIFYAEEADLKGSWFEKAEKADKKIDEMAINELRIIADSKGVKLTEKDTAKTAAAKIKRAIKETVEDDSEDIA